MTSITVRESRSCTPPCIRSHWTIEQSFFSVLVFFLYGSVVGSGANRFVRISRNVCYFLSVYSELAALAPLTCILMRRSIRSVSSMFSSTEAISPNFVRYVVSRLLFFASSRVKKLGFKPQLAIAASRNRGLQSVAL